MPGLQKNLSFILLLITINLAFIAPVVAADDVFMLEFDLDSRNTIDSTRKDYFRPQYQVLASMPEFIAEQYDRSFLSSENDMFIAVRGDLNETQFLDFKERIYFLHYGEEDYYSRAVNSRKIKEIDHEFNLTYGIAAGDHDYFQLDFFNNYYDVDEFSQWQTKANRGSGLFCHEFSEKTALSIQGAYEERQYDNDAEENFRTGQVNFEVLTYIRGHRKFKQLANSTRGNRSFFENFPNGMAARKAVDYYTDWTTSPLDDDPRAKYKAIKTRGDLYLRFYGEASTLERTRIDNRSTNAGIGLGAAYELSDDICLRIDDYYRKQDWRNESGVYFLYDNTANRLSLSATWEYNPELSQTISFIDEMLKNSNVAAENQRINILRYEGFYANGKTRGSLRCEGLRRRFDENRRFYPDEDEFKIAAAYEYMITEQLKFQLRSEYIDKDYLNFADDIWSSYRRNIWRGAVEKILSRNHSLEIAYQENSERHEDFNINNVEEKSLNLSWLMNF